VLTLVVTAVQAWREHGLHGPNNGGGGPAGEAAAAG
jgi:hypothetical protein